MIHPLAYVHPEARIADSVIVEPFAYIQKDVEIGEGTWVGPHVNIMDGARIGKYCKIFPGAVIAGIPQDLKFAGEATTATIGDYTTVRECCTINRGTQENWDTRVGEHCLLMAYVHLGHDCIVGNYCVLANNVTLAGHVKVHDWAILNGLTAVQQFLTVGAHTYIAGASLVRKDVPPFIRAAREPLSYSGVNVVGLQRRNFSVEIINQIHETYRVLFQQGLNISQAIEKIMTEIPTSPERNQIIDFVKQSEYGIIRGYDS